MFKIKNGRLTINSAIFLTHILISFILGITAPITVKFFTSHEAITTAILNISAICTTFAGALLAQACTSSKMLDWMTRRFIPISITADIVYLLIALFGAENPIERFLIYNIINILGVGVLRKVQKRNINLAMEGDGERLTIFDNQCTYYAKYSAVLGSTIGLILYFQNTKLDVTVAMFAEFAICAIAHALQIYANYRIQKEILHKDITQTFWDAINDLFKSYGKPRNFKKDDPFDI